MEKDRNGGDYRWNSDRPVKAGDLNGVNPVAMFMGPILTSALEVSATGLKALIDRGERFVLVNVLDRRSFEKAHASGSMNIPLKSIEREARKVLRQDELIVVCGRNRQSLEAAVGADKLHTIGFERVLLFRGNAEELESAGFALERGEKRWAA